jgi:hypothetical protein
MDLIRVGTLSAVPALVAAGPPTPGRRSRGAEGRQVKVIATDGKTRVKESVVRAVVRGPTSGQPHEPGFAALKSAEAGPVECPGGPISASSALAEFVPGGLSLCCCPRPGSQGSRHGHLWYAGHPID